MGFFDRFFKNRKSNVNAVQLVQEHGSGFYAWNGKLYQSDVIRSAVRPYALAVGKLSGKQVYETVEENNGIKTRKLEINPDAYIRFLLEEPNPYMSGQVMQEWYASQLSMNRNAFALILRDEAGLPRNILPINAVGVEAQFNDRGELFHRFTMANGKVFTFPDADVIHLRQDKHEHDIYGSPLGPAIENLMEVVSTTDQGLVKAVKNSAVIRWLLKYTSTLRKEDIKARTEEFAQNFLQISESTGVAATDASFDAQQIKPESYVPNASQMDRATQRIYALFNTNEKIVNSTYTENEWNSYFDAQIEPVLIALQNEYTRKLFTRRERAFGNKIVFEANGWDSASTATKLELVAMVDRGAMTPNEWRATFNLAPLPGGDEPVRRLDTAPVESKRGDDKGEGT